VGAPRRARVLQNRVGTSLEEQASAVHATFSTAARVLRAALLIFPCQLPRIALIVMPPDLPLAKSLNRDKRAYQEVGQNKYRVL
jgi:hypothetical protein